MPPLVLELGPARRVVDLRAPRNSKTRKPLSEQRDNRVAIGSIDIDPAERDRGSAIWVVVAELRASSSDLADAMIREELLKIVLVLVTAVERTDRVLDLYVDEALRVEVAHWAVQRL